MNSKFLTTLAAGLLLTSSLSLVCSPDAATNFFQFADRGSYIEMLNLAKQGLITTEDLYVARDANGNTLISAAIKGFPLAVAAYGDTNATEYLNTILDRLLPTLPKEQAAADLLNLQNTDKRTALQYAAQNGLLRTATVLHGKGALAITPDGKKASDFAQSKKINVVLLGWEKYEKDNVEKSVGDKFSDFGTDIKNAFSGPDTGASLEAKLESYKQKPAAASQQQAASTESSVTDKLKGLVGSK